MTTELEALYQCGLDAKDLTFMEFCKKALIQLGINPDASTGTAKKILDAAKPQVLSEPFATLKKMGWSGCMHDSDCACSIEVLENDRRVHIKHKALKK